MPTNVDRHEVSRLRDDDDAELLEVLPRPEYAWAHLPGAVNVPLKELDAEAVAELDRTKPIIVYCNDFQ